MKFKNYYYLDNIEPFTDILKGTTGEKGDTGFIGQTGDFGLRGLKGKIGPDGLQGSTGIQGPRGNKGDIGLPGKQGAVGKQGPKGIKGGMGIQGDEGLKGPTGARGKIGLKGNTGPNGQKGNKGAKGESGMSGSRNNITMNTDIFSDEKCWQDVSTSMDLEDKNKNRCPNNGAIIGLRSFYYPELKIESKWWHYPPKKCSWHSFISGCKTQPRELRTNDVETRYQYNRKYQICCAPMPGKDGKISIEKTNENIEYRDENIDIYYLGGERQNSKDKSLKNYPFYS